MNPELLSKLKETVYLNSNLHFPPQKSFLFEKRLMERVKELCLSSYEDYFKLLNADEKEIGNFLELLTNKETHFFRIMKHFEFLRAWLKKKGEELSFNPSLKIWSAGCSTGEEAYSISMTVLKALTYPAAWNIEIIGTDISSNNIKTAAEGRYDIEKIKEIPDDFREYINVNKKYISIKEAVKRLVNFEKRNIKEEKKKDYFDFIFCRNVLIYSDFEGQMQFIDSLYRALKPFGFLFTGEGEVLHILPHPFKTVESDGFILYQKIPSKYECISKKMESKDKDERLSAIIELGTCGDQEAAEHLLKSIRDENWFNRKQAFETLLSFEDNVLFSALQRALRDNKDAALRNLSIEVFTRLGRRPLPMLLSFLKDPDEEIRIFAANMLGDIKEPDSVPSLIESLNDPESNVRIASAEALGKIEDKRAIKPLIETLNGDLWLQFSAISALKDIGDRNAIEPLVKCIATPETQTLALVALAEILRRSHYFENIPVLRESLEKQDIYSVLIAGLRSKDSEQKKTSLILLGWLRDKKALPEMITLLADNELRDLAVETISLIGKDGIEYLRSQLKEPRILVRVALEEILGRINRGKGLKEDSLVPLMNLISDYSGIHLTKESPINLNMRLAPILFRGGFASLSEFYDYIKTHPEELPNTVSFIANNETYFFRESKQLEVFSQKILPEIAKNQCKELRILSAGCSTGEEVYTIGILLEESGLFRDWKIEILGIDIDSDAIETAKKGCYSRKSFRGINDDILWKYFIRHSEGFSVREIIKKTAGFSRGNVLALSPSLGNFDIIFCRNLLIYFADHAIEKASSVFYDLLKDGGHLLLGSSESLSRIDHKFKTVRYPGSVIYKK